MSLLNFFRFKVTTSLLLLSKEVITLHFFQKYSLEGKKIYPYKQLDLHVLLPKSFLCEK